MQYDEHQVIESNIDFTNFTNELLESIKIFTWKEDYGMDPYILDGLSWQLILTLDDNTKFSSEGINLYPYRFWKFVKLCKKYKFDIGISGR